jgi:hypothetical protein
MRVKDWKWIKLSVIKNKQRIGMGGEKMSRGWEEVSMGEDKSE